MKVHNVILINKQCMIDTIKEEFNSTYPFLKIEFFRKPHLKGIGTKKEYMFSVNEKIIAIKRNNSFGKIALSDDITVGELENIFENKFGLHVQVFRKSGNVWLETSATDRWTLKQQNEEGRNLQEHLKIEKENFDDHDIW